MPGFGPRSTAALASIGIASLEELRRRDPYEVYAALRKRVPGTSMNFLYGILAAVEGGDWREIQKNRRTAILLRLDELGIAPGQGK